MKNIKIAAVCFAICIALTACAAPHADGSFHLDSGTIPMPEVTPAPTSVPAPVEPVAGVQTVGQVVYNPLVIPSAFAESADFSAELFTLLATAVRSGAETADFGALSVNETQFNTVRKYLVARNFWGNISDITKGEGAQAVITYSSKEVPAEDEDKKDDKKDDAPEATQQPVQEDVDTVKRFDDAAAFMLQSVVKPESTQLSAAIALYKHIAQCVETDNEADELGMYSTLAQGKGTALSMANLYSFMLDQIGIKNVVVSSEDGSHAWNVLTIDDKSFHCDMQMEVGLSGSQALAGFGLSDADMARTNGWNTWVSENSALLTCSESLMPEIHAAQHADVDAMGNAVYFDGMDGMPGIWRMDLATGTVLQLTQEPVTALAVLGEHVYFHSEADGMLYRYRIADGDVRQAIEGVIITDMRRVGTELRYILADDPTQSENAISIE